MARLAAVETLATARLPATTFRAVSGNMARLAAVETLAAARLPATTFRAVARDVARLAAVETLAAAATAPATAASAVRPRHRIREVGEVKVVTDASYFAAGLVQRPELAKAEPQRTAYQGGARILEPDCRIDRHLVAFLVPETHHNRAGFVAYQSLANAPAALNIAGLVHRQHLDRHADAAAARGQFVYPHRLRRDWPPYNG